VRYELRYAGQSFELTVDGEIDLRDGLEVVLLSDAPPNSPRVPLCPTRVRQAFEEAHEQRYGYRDEEADVELVNMRVSALGARPELVLSSANGEPPMRASTQVVFDGEQLETELWRGELPAGARVRGPALCAMPESTLLVPPGWSGQVNGHGTVVLEHAGSRNRTPTWRARAR
jgi:N-methylhydantoinase A